MTEKPSIILGADLGIRLDTISQDQRTSLEWLLTAKSKAWKDDPDNETVVNGAYEDDGYLWVPRQFGLSQGFEPVQDNRIPGLTQDLEFKAKLDPARGQIEAVPEMVKYLRKNGSGLLVAPTGCGKTLLSYAIGSHFRTSIGVFVYARHMVRNWRRQAKLAFGLEPEDIGIVKQKRCDLGKPVTLMYIQSLLSRRYPDELYNQFGFLCADECVTGETLITTNKGKIPIKDFSLHAPNHVLSFNLVLHKWEMQRIKRWVKRSPKKIRTITTSQGQTLRCSKNHPVMTVNKGWVEAKDLKVGMRLLSPVDVVAELNLRSKTQKGDHADTYKGIILPQLNSLKNNVGSEDWSLKQMLRTVTVAVESELNSGQTLRQNVLKHHNGLNILTDMEVARLNDCQSVRRLTDYSTEHFSGIVVSHAKIHQVVIRLFHLLMAFVKNHGQNLNQLDYKKLDLQQKHEKMMDSEINQSSDVRYRIQRSYRFINYSGNLKLLRESGSYKSQKRASPGGIWMMDQSQEAEFHYTQRDSHYKKTKLLQNSYEAWASIPESNSQTEGTIILDYESKTQSSGSEGSENTQHQEWNTSFPTILKIEDGLLYEDTYDLEIEENHNFVANGILVHNCNRYGAEKWNQAIRQFPAAYRLGVSADPHRKDGLDNVIRWNLGDVGYVIDKHTVSLTVMKIHADVDYSFNAYKDWKRSAMLGMDVGDALRYDKQLAKDYRRNQIIMNLLLQARKIGRRVIVFSRLRDHLDTLKAMFDEKVKAQVSYPETVSAYLVGGMSEKQEDIAFEADVKFSTYAYARDALDDTSLDTMFFATPPGDPLQPAGRLRDKGSTERHPLQLVDFHESNDYSLQKWFWRLKVYDQLGFTVKEFVRKPE